jgi:hypothetical protein
MQKKRNIFQVLYSLLRKIDNRRYSRLVKSKPEKCVRFFGKGAP